jgi:hypothetical protein
MRVSSPTTAGSKVTVAVSDDGRARGTRHADETERDGARRRGTGSRRRGRGGSRSGGRLRSVKRDRAVAGLLDGGRDGGLVDHRRIELHRHLLGREVDVHALDAVDLADDLLDDGDARGTCHAGDREGGLTDGGREGDPGNGGRLGHDRAGRLRYGGRSGLRGHGRRHAGEWALRQHDAFGREAAGDHDAHDVSRGDAGLVGEDGHDARLAVG